MSVAESSASVMSIQIRRYIATGLVNTVLGLAVIFVLRLWVGLDLVIANASGYAAGWLVSYGLNRNWTFYHSGRISRSLPAYLALALAAFAINIASISTLVAHGMPYVPAQIIGVVLYSTIVFVGAKYVVFPDRH